MPDPIRADYRQLLLLPPSMDQWLPADHPARFIRDFVDLLDLQALGVRMPECRTGRAPFAPDLLLKVWLYGYFERMRSTRRLEWACYNVLPMIWLTGMNYPDHNTIWRFWDVNRQLMGSLLKQALAVAAQSGLVGMVLHALDGTKIAARVSGRTGWHRKELLEVLEEVDEAIEQISQQIESARQQEQSDPEYRMPQELQDAHSRREHIKEALAQLDEAQSDHLHPGERGARMMLCEGKVKFAYNAQAVLDEQSGLVVAADVSQEAADSEQLGPMLQKVERSQGSTARRTVADGGYWNPEQLAEVEQKGQSVVVNAPAQLKGGGEPFHKSQFRYDGERDVFICPQGRDLVFERSKPARHKKHVRIRVYRCKHRRDCSFAEQCSRQRRGRTIEKGPHYEAVMRQVERQRCRDDAEALAKRGQIVELAFGWVKANEGFRRWTVSGLHKVRSQWSLLCAVLNLRKLHRWWAQGKLELGADGP
jgi:transposase